MFGGGTKEEVFSLKSLDVFDLERRTWSKEMTILDPKQMEQNYPLERMCHSVCKWKNKCYILGGKNNSGILKDLWELDLDIFSWKLLAWSSSMQVNFHAATMLNNGRLFWYGGNQSLQEFSSESFKFEKQNRTAKLCSLSLQLPTLEELAIYSLFRYFPHLRLLDRCELRSLGVPVYFVNLIKGQQSSSPPSIFEKLQTYKLTKELYGVDGSLVKKAKDIFSKAFGSF